MRIAVEGCCHGELNKIYAHLASLDTKVDLLIICGDFQALRDKRDLNSMACPIKYRQMGDFADYYWGNKVAPVLTLFIGGNHEASNYLSELYHGGWVAPNIYYLGHAGVVRFGGLRIAGISGLYNPRHYPLGRYEKAPFTADSLRSVYHYRNIDVFKLDLLKEPVDIFISHEWPAGIYNYGDCANLLKRKPYFRREVEQGQLGARPLSKLLFKLAPRYWFSAHLHVHFTATVEHFGRVDQRNTTEFIALDKCLPRRTFMEVVNISNANGQSEEPHNYKFEYDQEWLGIVKIMDPFYKTDSSLIALPDPNTLCPRPVNLKDWTIPFNFTHSVDEQANQQTIQLCQLLGVPVKFYPLAKNTENPEEIDLE